jgi:hypothetical protein
MKSERQDARSASFSVVVMCDRGGGGGGSRSTRVAGIAAGAGGGGGGAVATAGLGGGGADTGGGGGATCATAGRGIVSLTAVWQPGDKVARFFCRHSSASLLPGVVLEHFSMKSERQFARKALFCALVN